MTQISINDNEYPEALRGIRNPPNVLFCVGDVGVLNSPCITMVGAREASLYGQRYAEEISFALAKHGFTIVSGMARGLDTLCHKGALAAGGKTVAVFGCGIDITYPPENRGLRKQIEQNGAIITEYSPGAAPTPYTFPQRNRITVGLSKATIVIECKENSGTWHSVKAARAAGRTIYTIPTTLNNPNGSGNIRLIREGAKVLTCADDLLKDLGIESDPETAPRKASAKRVDPILLMLKPSEAMSMPELLEQTNMSINELNCRLTMLELNGEIKALPGRRYILA